MLLIALQTVVFGQFEFSNCSEKLLEGHQAVMLLKRLMLQVKNMGALRLFGFGFGFLPGSTLLSLYSNELHRLTGSRSGIFCVYIPMVLV